MFLALTLLMLSATPDELLASGRGFHEKRLGPVRLGLSGAVASGPRALDYDLFTVVTSGELAGIVEFAERFTSFRFGLAIKFGVQLTPFVGASAWVDFLAFPVPRFGLGLSLEGTVLVFIHGYVVPTLVPGLTLGAVRLGDRRQHELSLVASATFSYDLPPPGLRGLVRYTYFF